MSNKSKKQKSKKDKEVEKALLHEIHLQSLELMREKMRHRMYREAIRRARKRSLTYIM